MIPPSHASGADIRADQATINPHAQRASTSASAGSTSDRPEGCIVPFVFDNSTGWVGFFILNESFRGFGYGGALFKALLQYFEGAGTRHIGLDGVAEQKATYERRGFVEKGMVRLMTRNDTKNVPQTEASLWEGEKIIPIRDVAREKLVENDLLYSGFERRRLWTDEALFRRNDVSGVAVVKGPDEVLEGWTLIRKCEHGYRIGPVYAHCDEVASLVLHAAMKTLEGQDGSLVAEAWMGNPDGVKIFENLGWKWAGIDYHRMWLNGDVVPQQAPGGAAEKGMFAIFDAGEG
jgi:hypothetical protein